MNEEKLIDVLAAIEKGEPGLSHSQDNWFSQDTHCGTTACLAGWTAHLAGYQPVWMHVIPFEDSLLSAFSVHKEGDGRAYKVAAVARQILELDAVEGNRLFHTAKSLKAVYRIAADIMGVDERVLRDKVRDRTA